MQYLAALEAESIQVLLNPPFSKKPTVLLKVTKFSWKSNNGMTKKTGNLQKDPKSLMFYFLQTLTQLPGTQLPTLSVNSFQNAGYNEP